MPDPFERPPIAQSSISVVLPAYDAEAGLEKVVGNWLAYLDSLGREYELFVVDDGSTDHTAEIVEALATKYPRLRLLRHPTARGFGAALRTGLAAAQYPLLFYSACTSSYQAADLARLLEVIDKVDLVSGCRLWHPGPNRPAWSRYAYRWLLRFLFGVRLKDVDCLFKLFRRSVFARMPIQSDGPFVNAEILAKANFLGCIMTEVPVEYQPGSASEDLHPSPSSWRAEASHVFFHPDFGPTVLPEQPAAPDPSALIQPSPDMNESGHARLP